MPLYAVLTASLDLSALPDGVKDALFNLIILPPVLFSLALAYLSGHVWAYVIFAKAFPDETAESGETKRTQYIRFVLDHNIGRIALGILWLALWLVALAVLPWLIMNRNLMMTTAYITSRLVITWILAMASQAVLSILLLFVPSRRAASNPTRAAAVKNNNAGQTAQKDTGKTADADTTTDKITDTTAANAANAAGKKTTATASKKTDTTGTKTASAASKKTNAASKKTTDAASKKTVRKPAERSGG